MTDRWTDRLSDFLDDALSPDERREVEHHLAECAACAAVLADLRTLVAAARSLPREDERRAAPGEIWPLIEARIRGASSRAIRPPRNRGWARQRFDLSVPQLAAACVTVLAISASVAWFAHDWGRREVLARQGSGRGRVVAVIASNDPGEAAQQEIEALKRLLEARRDEIDPGTLEAIEESLATVEAAVEQARRALEADPDNAYLHAHLEDLTHRQLELLRHAVDLAGGAE